MGLGLGWRGARGLCSFPLRPLELFRWRVGLVPRAVLRAPNLRPCVRWFLWRRELLIRIRLLRRDRLVPAWIWGTLLSLFPLQPRVYREWQRPATLYSQYQ